MATRRRHAAGPTKAITRGRAKPARGAMRARTAERVLRASAARFRSLTQLSADWYWELDAEFRLTHMSSYVGDKQPALNLTEADWERHRAQLERREPFRDFEIQRAASDGHSVWLSLSGEPVFDDRGRFKGYRGVGRDVTAQKRAEQMLRLEHQVAHALAGEREPNEVVRAVIRAVCEVQGWACGRYFRLDEASGLLRFQDAWCGADPVVRQFVERSRTIALRAGEGLSGNAWQSGEPIWSQDTVRDPRVQHKTLWEGSGLHGGFAFAVVAEGGVIGVLTFSSQAVREPDQRLVQAARVIGSQIGPFLKRKQAEESQRESELRFRSLVQMSSDFFWETDAQDRFTEMVQGPNYVDTVAGAGEAGWGELRGMFQARAPFRDFEFGRPWPDGSIRYFSVSGEPRFGTEGAFLGYRGVGRDITEIALARERIASLAYSDPLTGLANRPSLPPARRQAGRRVHGPRRLQADQRRARPRYRRRAADRRRAPAAHGPARERLRGAARGRRVLRGDRGGARRAGGGRHRPQAPFRAARALRARRRQARADHRQPRRERLPGRCRRRPGPHEARRHGDVRGEGGRQELLPVLPRGTGQRSRLAAAPAQVAVRVLDVAAQLLALLGRHLALLLGGPPAAITEDVAHVFAHALALLAAHVLRLEPAFVPLS